VTTQSDKYEIKNLPGGTYVITAFDNNWCEISKTVVVTGGSPNIDITLTPQHGVCETPGQIKVKILSGKAPYKITWDGPGSNDGNTTTSNTTFDITNLPGGAYTVTVKDANGCTIVKTTQVNVSQNNLQIVAITTNGTCNSLGSVKITVNGGSPNYIIAWDGPVDGSQTTASNNYTISSLPAGSYTIKVTDGNWCTTTKVITIHTTTGELFKAKPISGVCETPGSIRLSFVGGQPVYQVSWTGPTPGAGSTSDSAFVLQNLAAGTYIIKVTDKNGCTETKTVVLHQNAETVDFDLKWNVNACGQYTNVWIDIFNGLPPYTIKWDGPGNQDGSDTTSLPGTEIQGLLPGKYTITIFDNNWCYGDTMITIYNTPIDIFTPTVIQEACTGNGAIKLSLFGDEPTYQIKWDGPVDSTAKTNDSIYIINNLPAGTYIVTVTGARNCSEQDTVVITGNGFTADILGVNGNCADKSKIKVDLTSGTGPFQVIVNGVGFLDTISVHDPAEVVVTDLLPGAYTVTVKNTGGCSITKQLNLSVNESSLEVIATVKNATCNGKGAVELKISEGFRPYKISWKGQGVQKDTTILSSFYTIPNLAPGTYSITVTNSLGCSVTKEVKIIVSESNLQASATVTNGTCGQAGQILVSLTGGTAPYKYQWSGAASGTQTGNSTSYTIQNAANGTYNITVTDAAGCTKTASAHVANDGGNVTAGFTFIIEGKKVTFTNVSSAGTYQWTFGDQTNSTEKNPLHTYQNSGAFNVCLKVTNACGTKEICKEVTIASQEGVIMIDVEDGSAGVGETIYVPVVVKNCVTGTLVSFAGSLQIDNTNIAVIKGIQPGSITPQYFANNQTFSFYASNGNGLPCGEGQILFYVAVELKGDPGTSTVLRIVNTPLSIEVGGMKDGIPVSVPHFMTSGLVAVASVAVLQGDVNTYWGDPLPSVEVAIQNATHQKKDTTNNNGNYNITQLPMGKEYMVQPKLDGDPANGLSTYALFAGQRFILGMQPEEIISPYQIIAGDANCDGRFSTLDLFIIQRVIIGTSENFGNCPPWVFVRASDPMPLEFTTTNVFPYHNCDTLMLMKDTVSNFIGVKVGDILGHANPALLNIEPRGLDVLRLIAQNRAVHAGEIVEIQLTSENFRQIASYQLGLSFDFNKLEFIELATAAQSPFGSMAVNRRQAKNGLLRLSWFDPSGRGVSTKAEDQVFTLRFRALADLDNLANLLEINSRTLRSEAYTTAAEPMHIALQFINTPVLEPNEQVAVSYKLYQNVPNPFNQQTIIGFDLPEAMQAELVVFDQLGRAVKTFSGNYNRGYNRVELPRAALNAGVYYYTLRTGNFVQTKSMIIVE
jgi:PKD repeat protein